MGSSKSKSVAPPYAPTYCDFQQHRSSNIVPTLWEVPAAKAILLGTLDQNCMFSTVSARVTEQILKTILMDAYALCSDESSAGRYDWSKAYQSRGCAYNSGSGQGLIIAAGCGDVLGVSSVCLLAPHLLLHKRENEFPKGTALHVAVKNNQLEIVERILSNIAQTLQEIDQVGRTALHWAVEHVDAIPSSCTEEEWWERATCCEMVALLLRFGADKNAKDAKGDSAYRHARC